VVVVCETTFLGVKVKQCGRQHGLTVRKWGESLIAWINTKRVYHYFGHGSCVDSHHGGCVATPKARTGARGIARLATIAHDKPRCCGWAKDQSQRNEVGHVKHLAAG